MSTYTTLRDILYNTSELSNDVMSGLWSHVLFLIMSLELCLDSDHVSGVMSCFWSCLWSHVLFLVLFHDVISMFHHNYFCFRMTDHVLWCHVVSLKSCLVSGAVSWCHSLSVMSYHVSPGPSHAPGPFLLSIDFYSCPWSNVSEWPMFHFLTISSLL